MSRLLLETLNEGLERQCARPVLQNRAGLLEPANIVDMSDTAGMLLYADNLGGLHQIPGARARESRARLDLGCIDRGLTEYQAPPAGSVQE